MKKVGFIVETDNGDSVAYSFLLQDVAGEYPSDMAVWGQAVLRGYDYVPKDSKVVRFEFEFEEEVEA